MAMLWITQVILLNTFYGAMKTQQTESVAREIDSAYKLHDQNDFIDEVNGLSRSYDMYIYVVSLDGQTTYLSPSSDLRSKLSDFAPEDFSHQIQLLNEQMIKGEGSATVKIKGFESGQEILAYGKMLGEANKEPLIVYIFSPLWPLSSTIRILADQLIVVTLFSLILACIISFYLSTRITNPIRRINRSAKKLAQGNYGIVFSGGHYTELNNLADTLTGASLELEKSMMMQKDLIANVSHDLRTPLTMIRSYAELIRDISGNNPLKRDEHLQVIIDESERLNTLVGDLLTVSRLQSGKLALDKKEFNLSECVESVLNTYKIMELEEHYTFTLDCPSGFVVNADEEKIKQVITNLVTNAIKFCGDDKKIEVVLKRKGKQVILSVIDHGIGIPQDELGHIWERYYSASRNMTRETEGSGLGLSICKEILTLHKSRYGVNSTVGSGSEFWFTLDIVKIKKR